MTLLLTLSTPSLRDLFEHPEKGPASLLDVPGFAIDQMTLRGLYVDANMLTGWSLTELDRLRDRADKSACPCLVLYDEEPLPLASHEADRQMESLERIERLAMAANRLGCNSLSIQCADDSTDEAIERATECLRGVMESIERLELNLLLAPSSGMTATADGLTDLVKQVGGFRIGVMPTYGTAHSGEEEIERLRRLAPYAGAIRFQVKAFKGKSGHQGTDLKAGIETLKKVGYASTVAIDYVSANPLKDIDLARAELQAAIEAE